MELTTLQPDTTSKSSSQCGTNKLVTKEVISLEECKQYIGAFPLPDQRILEIRNNMIGIVEKVIGAYLKDFEYEDGKRVR